MPLPDKYSEVLKDLAASQQNYAAQRKEQRLVRRTYMQLLLLITLLVLFASTWFALSLSKAVTRPVLALAQGTNEISGGRLDYRVEVAAGDELADLVNLVQPHGGGAGNRPAADRDQPQGPGRRLRHPGGARKTSADHNAEHSHGGALAGRKRESRAR